MEHFIDTVRKYPCLWNTTAIEYRDQELKDAAWSEVMKETDLSSVKEVKLKWKKLRDSYRDALKRQNELLARDPGNPSKRAYPWKYMGHMQFLQPYMSNRKKVGERGESPPTPRYAPPAPPADNGHNGGCAERSSSESESEPESEPKRRACDRLSLTDRKPEYVRQPHGRKPAAQPPYREREHRRERERERTPPPPIAAPTPPPAPDPLEIFFNGMCQSTKRFPFHTQIKIKRSLFTAVIEAEEALLAEQQSYASLWARAASSSSSDVDGDAQNDKPS